MKFFATVLIFILLLSSFSLAAPNFNALQNSNAISNHTYENKAAGQLSQPGNNTTIGSNNENSTYHIENNLTVARNQSLTFLSCIVTVSGNTTINVAGSLILENSSLLQSQSNDSSHSINLIVNGTPTSRASIALMQSTVKINGNITTNNSKIVILNSTVSSNSEDSWIRYSFQNSFLDINGSAVTGLHGEDENFEVTTGLANSTGYPIAKSTYLKLNGFALQNLPVTSVKVNVLVSGIDPKGMDFLNLTIPGDPVYKIAFSSTSSVYDKSWENFSINLSNPVSIRGILGNLSSAIFYNFSYYTGSNLTLWNVSVDFMSNDIVDYLGNSSFNYLLRNTTLLSFNSTFELSKEGGTSLVPNPNNHLLILNRGSKAVLETKTHGLTGMPFSIDSTSQVNIYGMINVYLESSGREVEAFNITVLPYVPVGNIENQFGQIIHGGNRSQFQTLFLLSEVAGSGGTVYYGDYRMAAYGYNKTISMQTGTDLLNNPEQNVTIEMSLPRIDLSVASFGISNDGHAYLNIQYNGTLPPNGTSTLFLELDGYGLHYNASEEMNQNQEMYNISVNNTIGLQGKFVATMLISFSGEYKVDNYSFYRADLNFTGYPGAIHIESLHMSDPWNLSVSLSGAVMPQPKSCKVVISYVGVTGNSWNSTSVIESGDSSVSAFVPVNTSYVTAFASTETESNMIIQSPTVYFSVSQARLNMTEEIMVEESGLANNSTWELYTSNASLHETGKSAVLDVSWGTKTLLVSASAAYAPQTTYLELSWNSTHYQVNFTQRTFVLYVVSNLQDIFTTSFQLNISGVGLYSGSLFIEVTLPYGNYSLQIYPPSGYSLEYGITQLMITGNMTIFVSFTPVPPVPNYVLYTGIVIISSFIGAVAFIIHRRWTARICAGCGNRIDGKKS